MVGYGLWAILFFALFYFDPNTSAPAYNELKAIAFWVFVPYGLLSVFVAWAYHRANRDEDQGTLPFSGKYFAAVQIPFIWAQHVAIPGTVWDTQTPGVIQWAVVCGIPIGITHLFVYLVKNPRSGSMLFDRCKLVPLHSKN